MSYVFGIDLGTTYSCVAYVNEYNRADVLDNSDEQHTTPSVVMIEGEDEDEVTVGINAKNCIKVEPGKVIVFVKRKIGKSDDEDKVICNGKEYSATEISSYILKKIVKDANDRLREKGVLQEDEDPIKDVVITCPAYFGEAEREATRTAGKIANLNVLDIINEPTAAAINYGVIGENKDETVLVYDLGGGTFDITVMNINGSNIEAVCTGGDPKLGGKDWDEAIIDYICEKHQQEHGEDLKDNLDNVDKLYLAVEEGKKKLTVKKECTIQYIGPDLKGYREKISREKFDELTNHLLNRTKNLLDDMLKTAEQKGYPKDKIDKVLLVGGSSKMPQVKEMLKKEYGMEAQLTDPDEAVAKGAAIYAQNRKAYNDFVRKEAEKTGKTVEELNKENLEDGKMDEKFALSMDASTGGGLKINITNVLSRTYGIEIVGDLISNMLMINDKLPASNTRTFSTVYDNQKGADIKLYETRETDEVVGINGRIPITTIKMSFNRPVPKETAIEMTMALDNSGIIHIFAKEKLYDSQLDTTFELPNQMSEEEINRAAIKLENTSIQ